MSNSTMAKIAVKKSLCKEYNNNNQRTVYLKDGQEFQIQLFNNSISKVGCKIFINGIQESEHMLVINGNDRVWLERYLGDNHKFKYETMKVAKEFSDKSFVKHLGEVKIEFYKKKEPQIIWVNTYTTTDYKWNTTPLNYPQVYYNSDTAINTLDNNINFSTSVCALSSDDFGVNTANSCTARLTNDLSEIGSIEKGSKSSQTFDNCYDEFESLPFNTEIIYIKPESTKPITVNDLHKQYCGYCGHKVNSKFKYCPYCGKEL